MLKKAEAEERGAALLARMKGKGWRLRVWENLGWHYAVSNGAVEVFPAYSRGRFHCLPKPSFSFWCDQETYTDPNKVVLETVKLCRAVVNGYEEAVKAMERKLPKPLARVA